MSVRLKGLKVVYPNGVKALEVEYLELPKGVHLILGRSGSGKSTLGKVLTGIIPEFERAFVSGIVDVPRPSIYVHQNPYDQTLTSRVIDELEFTVEFGNADRKDVEWVVRTLRLEELLERDVLSLSGGELQKVVIASALIRRPRLLVLDEPLAHLDPFSIDDLMSLLTKIKDLINVILVIEHRVKELVRYHDLFDYVVIIDQGRIIDVFNAEGLYIRAFELERLGLRIPANMKAALKMGMRLRGIDDMAPLYMLLSGLRNALSKRHRHDEGEYAIKARDVWFSYGKGRNVLRGVNLEVRKGNIVVLLGRNGSGKTTLLLILAGALKARKGSIFVRGKTAYVPQNPDLMLFADTVEEELYIRAKGSGMSREEALRLVRDLAKSLGISDLLHRSPQGLSRGQRFKVALAAALASRPDVLLLDEVTTGQDEDSILALGEILEEFASSGGSALIATHDVYFAYEYGDYAYYLESGRIVAQGDVIDVLSRAGYPIPELAKACIDMGLPPLREREVFG